MSDELTIAERQERAYRVALIYAHMSGAGEEIEAAIIDLSADLLHLCVQYGFEVDELQRITLNHYQAETANERAGAEHYARR